MIEIIGMIMPFESQQDFHVYKDNNKIDEFSIKGVNELPKQVIYHLADYKNEDIMIRLKGPKAFSKKLGEGIKEQEVLQYKTSKIQVQYI